LTVGGGWPLDELHGGTRDSTDALMHFGARHMLVEDGRWLQPEPLLYMGVTNGDLTNPLGYGPVYARGNSNLYGDPTGEFAALAVPPATAATAVAVTGGVVAAVAIVEVATDGGLSQAGTQVSAAVGQGVAATASLAKGAYDSASQWIQNAAGGDGGARSDDDLIESVTGGAPPVQQAGRGRAEVHNAPGDVEAAEGLFEGLAGEADVVDIGDGKKLAKREDSNVVYRPPEVASDGPKPATVEIQTPTKGAEGNRKVKFPSTTPVQ